MSTSLYGTVKKIGSSQFTFDRIYSSRYDMEQHMNEDGIYHNRYVLVSYGDEQNTNSSNGASIQVINQETGESETYLTSYTQEWIQNYNIDISRYNNQYDKTVWQKVFDGTTAKYIMVASLNARAPGLTINEDYYSFSLNNDEEGKDYWIKGAENNPRKATASYPIPKWHETLSNELIYHLDMPMPLRINLANDLEYFKDGLDPAERSTYESDDKDNYIRWEHILKPNTDNEVIGADFNFHVPGLGQALSDAYDALYGVPVDEDGEPTTGVRPSHESLDDVLEQTDYIGLLGILANLNLQGNTYYFRGDWNASSSDFGHIEHKPDKITDITVANNGLWTITTVAQ